MKKKYFLISIVSCLLLNGSLFAQDVYQKQRAGWLDIAEATKPKLIETVKRPIGIVSVVKDEKAYQGWKVVSKQPMDSLYTRSMKKQSGVVLDFGEQIGRASCRERVSSPV